ncbi:MAG: hypothetical protein V1776_02175 [Candidatus Diapherotrites archaeon]
MRGYVSLLLLLTLSMLLATLHATQGNTTPYEGEEPILFLRRTEMENGIDLIIHQTLHEGLILQQEPNTIQTRIHERILTYATTFSTQHGEPITYRIGMGNLTHTQYLSLLDQILFPTTITSLNENSHVLILPLTGNARYGEYSYTGGAGGNQIFQIQLETQNHQTIVVIPSGYRACVTTFSTKWECAPYEGK